MGKMVHLRMSEALFEDSSRIAEESGFGSLQEYFRNALREKTMNTGNGRR